MKGSLVALCALAGLLTSIAFGAPVPNRLGEGMHPGHKPHKSLLSKMGKMGSDAQKSFDNLTKKVTSSPEKDALRASLAKEVRTTAAEREAISRQFYSSPASRTGARSPYEEPRMTKARSRDRFESEPEAVAFKETKMKSPPSTLPKQMASKVVGIRKGIKRKWKEFNRPDYYDRTHVPHGMTGHSAQAEAFNNGYYKRSLVEDDQVMAKRAGLREGLAKVRAVTKQFTFGSRSAAFRKAEEKQRAGLEREAAYLKETKPSMPASRPLRQHERAEQTERQGIARDLGYIKMQKLIERNPKDTDYYQRQYLAAHPPPKKKGIISAIGRALRSNDPSRYDVSTPKTTFTLD